MKKILLFITLLIPLLNFAQETTNELLATADSLYAENNYKEAAIIYKKVTNNFDFNSKAYNMLAKCYVSTNNLDSAKNILNKSINIDGNDAESYANLANICISLNQIDSAIIYIQSAKILNPDTAEYDVIEGSIYLVENNQDTAFVLFNQALKKNPKNSKALYFISYLYSTNDILDSALKYVNLSLQYEKNADYYKLKADILYKTERYTDALFEINKAIKLENNISNITAKAKILSTLEQYRDLLNLVLPNVQNSYNYDLVYYTIISYYNLGMNDSAFYYLSYAHQEDSENDLFYYLEGYIYYLAKNYENAYLNFKVAIELNPLEPDYFYLYSESKILMNTDTITLDMNKKFIDFNQSNMQKMKKLTTSKKSKYYFSKILAKFNSAPTSLSLDEYFMFYFGNSQKDNYSGYSNSNPNVARLFEDENYNECINTSKLFLKDHPTSITTYYYLANSYYMLKNYKLALKYLTPYYGFINSIIATGDGMSAENPFIITSIVDEYAVLRFYGVTFAGQELYSEKKHNYDIIYYMNNDQKNSIYFNIDTFFGKY